MSEKLRQAMQVRQLFAGITGLTLGLLLDIFSDWLKGPGARFIPLVMAIFCVGLLLSIWLWWRSPNRIALHLKPIKTLRTKAEKQEHARRGLLAFVSLYRPGRTSPAAKLTKEQWAEAAKNLDYAALDLPSSNLGPTIEAILTHASRLEHCWLIGTTCTNPKTPGSSNYIPVLIEYLRCEHGLQCEFHYEGFEVCLDDDALIFNRTLVLMRNIFKEAQEKNLATTDLIADFTSGIRSMGLGMILSCLDPDRDIEMIGTHYDDESNPVGPPFPIIYSFYPILQQE
ncbi:MAG: hypothetical protein ACUVR2_02760 [Anaerolineae bacterium]